MINQHIRLKFQHFNILKHINRQFYSLIASKKMDEMTIIADELALEIVELIGTLNWRFRFLRKWNAGRKNWATLSRARARAAGARRRPTSWATYRAPSRCCSTTTRRWITCRTPFSASCSAARRCCCSWRPTIPRLSCCRAPSRACRTCWRRSTSRRWIWTMWPNSGGSSSSSMFRSLISKSTPIRSDVISSHLISLIFFGFFFGFFSDFFPIFFRFFWIFFRFISLNLIGMIID